MKSTVATIACLFTIGTGCLDPGDDQLTDESLSTEEQELIIDDEDWDDLANHISDPGFGNGYHHGKGVASIAGCTAFLIGRDLIMTAAHCLRNASGTRTVSSVTATFGRERNLATGVVPLGDAYTCPTLVNEDTRYDVAVFRCSPKAGVLPGDRWTILPLSRTQPDDDHELYSITNNCRTGDCGTVGNRLLFSPGGSDQTSTRFEKCNIGDPDDSWTVSTLAVSGFETSCDVLPGSSGGPVLYRTADLGVAGVWSRQFSNLFTTHNDAGAVWQYVRDNDADGNRLLDFAEHKILVGDFDGDWRDDLVKLEMGQPGAVRVYLSNGTVNYPTPTVWANWFMSPTTHVVVGDFNGDWKDDLLKIDNGTPGGVWVGISNGTGFTTTKWADWWMDPTIHVVAGDFTGDGKTDVLKFDNGTPGGVWLGRSTGSGLVTTLWTQWLMDASIHVVVGDFDNNGRDDIAKIDNGSPGGVWVGLSFASGISTTKWADWWMDPSIHVMAGDYNGDGKTDLMKLDNGGPGGVWVGLSSGSALTTTKWADWWMSPTVPVLSGRFAGLDAREDILKVDPQWQAGALRLWTGRSDPSGTFAGIMGPVTWIQPQFDLLAADVNGDLRTDVVIFGDGQPGTPVVRLTP